MAVSLRPILVATVMVMMAERDVSAAELAARLADPPWDGATIPKNHICKVAGAAAPTSPRILVENIPAGTTKIVVAFNDESYPKLATDGGHGKISVIVPKGANAVTVPAVPSESESLPDGVTVEAKHRSTTPGYYLAPCSRGQNHVYAAELTAVKSGWFGTNVLGRNPLAAGKVLTAIRIPVGSL